MMIGSEKTHWTISEDEHGLCFSTTGSDEYKIYLEQLEEENFVDNSNGYPFLSWEKLYLLKDNNEHADSISLLSLPEELNICPILTSKGTLSDPDFRISVKSWITVEKQYIPVGEIKYHGAVIEWNNKKFLFPNSQYQFWKSVRAFHKRSERSFEYHQEKCAEIKKLAYAANARMDDFLKRTIILKPDTLKLHITRGSSDNHIDYEVAPGFEKEPTEWIEAFDKTNSVRNSYKITTASGELVHIIIDKEVKNVLEYIKSLPRRRIPKDIAEEFVYNPYAFLGENAESVLPQEELDNSFENAGLSIYQHQLEVHTEKNKKIEKVNIKLSQLKESGKTDLLPLKNSNDLKNYLEKARTALNRNKPTFIWNKYLLRTSDVNPEIVATILDELTKNEKDYLNSIIDISKYGDRVTGIGPGKIIQSEYLLKDSRIIWIDQADSELENSQHPTESPAFDDLTSRDNSTQNATTVSETGHSKKSEFNEFPDSGSSKNIARNENTDFLKKNNFTTNHILQINHNIESQEFTGQSEQKDYEKNHPDFIPDSFRKNYSLLPHQQQGISWINHCYTSGLRGCILADDMGLGKTVQLLSFIVRYFEKTDEKNRLPVLVLAPVSLLTNWEQELYRFFKEPPLKVQVLHDETLRSLRYKKDELKKDDYEYSGYYRILKSGWRNGDLIITTYDTLRTHQFSFGREEWFCVICDEAQKIKNPTSFVTQAVKAVGSNARFCIACTGTPVENSLADLWCLFDFVSPGYLGSLNHDFGPNYQRPIEQRRAGHENISNALREKIKPFVLRRMKEDIAHDMPKKLESSPEIELSDFQIALYNDAIMNYRQNVRYSKNIKEKKNPVLTLLNELRLICANPKAEYSAEHLHDSPKLMWLKQKLQEIQKKEEKVIIFTEFRSIQRALKEMIRSHFNLNPHIINGSTTTSRYSEMSRQNQIDEFQRASGFNVIILSTSAVGFGVNIQEANHVIHFTRSWNPAKEDQATDRAYRIGQKKDVYVYYPTMKSNRYRTFEVNLDLLLRNKRQLAKDMLAVQNDITADELVNSIEIDEQS